MNVREQRSVLETGILQPLGLTAQRIRLLTSHAPNSALVQSGIARGWIQAPQVPPLKSAEVDRAVARARRAQYRAAGLTWDGKSRKRAEYMKARRAAWVKQGLTTNGKKRKYKKPK